MKKILFSLSLFLAANLALSHAQQFYRWVDAQGNTHYTQYSPDESRAQAINFDPANPPKTTSPNDVKTLDVFQSSTAILIEIPQRKPFNPKDREAAISNIKIVGEALDPKAMDYCQTIQVNLQSFTSLEKGDFDQLFIISQAGERSRLSSEEVQEKYKATIDNLEKHCL